MFLDKTDIFNTPKLRYYELRRKFQEKYLNPQVWNHEYGSRESIQAYHALLVYLEKTEVFADEDDELKNDIPTDNKHLVFRYLPLPMEEKKELIDFVKP